MITQELQDKLISLEEALESEIPSYAIHLRDIQKMIQADPNQVTILSDQEMSVIVSGLKKLRDVSFVSSKKQTEKKKISSFTLEDI